MLRAKGSLRLSDDDLEDVNRNNKLTSDRFVLSKRRQMCLLLTGLIVSLFLFMIRFILSQSLSVELLEENRPSCVIRVNTFRRNDLLAKFVAHYEICDAVAEITVVWSDTEKSPPKWLSKRPKVDVEVHSLDSLNNRFLPLKMPLREGVLSLDDDVFVTCQTVSDLAEAFATSPRQMIGLAPRLVSRNAKGLDYLLWWHVWWNNAYSLVLTKVSIFHRDYYYDYSENPLLADIRKHVHDHRNCEDIAMSFLVANATKAPAVWLRAPYTDYGQSFLKHAGISAAPDHHQIRIDCLTTFSHYFQDRLPLKTGHLKLKNANNDWLW